MSDGYAIVLPFPPSVNSIWRSVGKKNGKARFIKSKSYAKWQSEAAIALYKQEREVFTGKVRATYLFSGKNRYNLDGSVSKRHPDLDNLAKALGDFLETQGIIKNDRDIMDLRLIWDDRIEKGNCIVDLHDYEGQITNG